ncbi:MAG: DUF4258 domain-containing protein [Candidatus Poribacteria bacterium]|nr:DUF4258 domain-containing protein [Candidatus Poribacteria bacterium]
MNRRALDDIRVGSHARRAMLEDDITFEIIVHVLRHGDAIEDYPNDERGPSYLVLGFWDDLPIHVCAANKDAYTFVITTYRPDPARWDHRFRLRRKSE